MNTIQTSRKQYPALFRIVPNGTGKWFDYGCGKYPSFMGQLVAEKGYEYQGYEPNTGHGKLEFFEYYDVVTCSNVLNVLSTDEAICNVLADLHAIGTQQTIVYISVYEGNRSGIGKETRDGYQRNERAERYQTLIESFFSKVTRKGNCFVCEK